jgi:hypothetical protein
MVQKSFTGWKSKHWQDACLGHPLGQVGVSAQGDDLRDPGNKSSRRDCPLQQLVASVQQVLAN